MKYLANAFSMQMVKHLLDDGLDIHMYRIPRPKKAYLKKMYSCIGHKEVADELGVEYNRESISLNKGDELYVVQVVSGRLPENTRQLSEDVKFDWFKVVI